MAELKPVYLIWGDDSVRVDAWRDRLRARAEQESGPGALESFAAPGTTTEDIATALSTLSMAIGVRYLLADQVEGWKARDLDPLEAALADLPPETVLVLIARARPLDRLVAAVEQAGGEVRSYLAPKAWEMPKWVIERGRADGLKIDQAAARELVGTVGGGAQRLASEIDKLALYVHPRTEITLEDVERLTGSETSVQAYELADAIVSGEVERSVALAEELARDDDRPARLAFPIIRRLREVHRATALIGAGLSEKDAAAKLGQPAWLAKRTLARARTSDRETLEAAICAFAELEVATRGGGTLDESTAFSLTLVRAAGG